MYEIKGVHIANFNLKLIFVQAVLNTVVVYQMSIVHANVLVNSAVL